MIWRMHKTLRQLPSLDFLKGFEAAGRRLSFTRAAQELFVTQSALSRQVPGAGARRWACALFERRHRALALTPAGAALHREVTAALAALASAAERARAGTREPGLTLTTTVSFASLWIIPRLPAFRALRPDVEVYVSADDRTVDLARGEVDLASAICAEETAPRDGLRLFGERMLPVVSPAARARSRHAAPAARGSRPARAAASRRSRGPHAVARLARVARRQRRARPQAGRIAALHALRPGDPGGRRRAGRRAGAAADDRRAAARRPAGRAVSAQRSTRRAATTCWSRRTPASVPTCARSSPGLPPKPRRRRRRPGPARRRGARRVRGRRSRAPPPAPGASHEPNRTERSEGDARQRPEGGRGNRRRRARGAGAFGLDRALRAAGAPRRPGAGPRLRGGPPRALLRRRAAIAVVAVDRDAAALAALAGEARIETRAVDLEAGAVAVRRRALRRDRRHQLPAPAAVSRAARRARRRTASCSTRPSRAATRPSAGPPIRTSCWRPASCWRWRRGGLTVVAFEQGLVRARAAVAAPSSQRLAAVGPAPRRGRPAAAARQGDLSPGTESAGPVRME